MEMGEECTTSKESINTKVGGLGIRVIKVIKGVLMLVW